VEEEYRYLDLIKAILSRQTLYPIAVSQIQVKLMIGGLKIEGAEMATLTFYLIVQLKDYYFPFSNPMLGNISDEINYDKNLTLADIDQILDKGLSPLFSYLESYVNN
jgi:hypothetical protein